MSIPAIAIVGRPNVGKSSLFNRLLKRRQAIVGDRPGVTVDRVEHVWDVHGQSTILVDTGGIGETPHGTMQDAIDQQVQAALDVAHIVFFVVDGQCGLTTVDQSIARKLRHTGLPIILVVNKAEAEGSEMEFHRLGITQLIPTSAVHGKGIKELLHATSHLLPKEAEVNEEDDEDIIAKIAIIGRPNVGKSSLVNRWIGRDRMVVSPIAGTTRDAIDTDIAHREGKVRLIDTAGQRKQGRINDVIEFVSRVKGRQALHRAQAAVLLLDGEETIVEQDMRLIQMAQDEGSALVIAVNKSDAMTEQESERYEQRLSYRMRSQHDLKVCHISAQTGQGCKALLKAAIAAAKRNQFTLSTGELNRWLEYAEQQQYVPHRKAGVIRLKYATQVTTNPPTIKIFSNRPTKIKETYVRYLEQSFKKNFDLAAVPVRFIFDGSTNPYMPDPTKKHIPDHKKK
ncbi:MAG: ribosome biogenesis GTPase Der [Mariprofundaceae bacterium]|nr:ribosome biogenesis GTPase Der [Mariprofundaceae bacterium]